MFFPICAILPSLTSTSVSVSVPFVTVSTVPFFISMLLLSWPNAKTEQIRQTKIENIFFIKFQLKILGLLLPSQESFHSHRSSSFLQKYFHRCQRILPQ